MEQVVTITSQGQLTIPQAIRKQFGMRQSVKAILRVSGREIIVRPQGDFASLSGSLKSKVKLSDAQLKKARAAFGNSWARSI